MPKFRVSELDGLFGFSTRLLCIGVIFFFFFGLIFVILGLGLGSVSDRALLSCISLDTEQANEKASFILYFWTAEYYFVLKSFVHDYWPDCAIRKESTFLPKHP